MNDINEFLRQLVDQISILETVVKGLIIGIVASAPMGPVGVLCIQRTLNKGRIYGVVTGLGAAISDIIYALITGYGLSFIYDFIHHLHIFFFPFFFKNFINFNFFHFINSLKQYFAL